MDNAPLLIAVGRILRERFEEFERALAAVRLTKVELTSPGEALLTFGDGSTRALQLPRGEPGTPGAPGAPGVGEKGEKGTPGEPGTHGERGLPGADGVGIAGIEQEDESPSAFTIRFTNGESVDVELPRGRPGDKGEKGDAGLDRFIASPRAVADGERVEKNDLVAWGGGIMQALRSTTRSPADDPASYACIVAGLDELSLVENIETRHYELTARLTNGIEQVCRLRAMPRLLGDGPRPGEAIIKGDQFVKGDWLYTATQDGADPLATEAGGWRRQYMRGKRGEDGARGLKGDPGAAGVGIVELVLDDAGILAVTLSTGEEKFVDARPYLARVAA